MRVIAIAALAALSLSAHAVEYTPNTDVAFDIIHMHDTTTWEKVCESSDGVCDVPEGTYQVKLLDRNWKELVRLRDVRVQLASPQEPDGTDNDMLAGLDCGQGQHIIFDTVLQAWICNSPPAAVCPSEFVSFYVAMKSMTASGMNRPIVTDQDFFQDPDNSFNPECGYEPSSDSFARISMEVGYPAHNALNWDDLQTEHYLRASRHWVLEDETGETFYDYVIDTSAYSTSEIDACAIMMGCPTLAESQ